MCVYIYTYIYVWHTPPHFSAWLSYLQLFLPYLGLPSTGSTNLKPDQSSTSSIFIAVVVARAAIAKYHKLSGLTNRNGPFHSSVGQKFTIKVSAGSSSHWRRMEISVPGSLLASGRCLACGGIIPVFPWQRVCVQISPLYKHTSHVGLRARPTPVWPHLN